MTVATAPSEARRRSEPPGSGREEGEPARTGSPWNALGQKRRGAFASSTFLHEREGLLVANGFQTFAKGERASEERMAKAFRETVGCEFRSLGDLRSDLRKWLEASDVPLDDRAPIVLAVHEAAANALEHAGAPDSVAVRARVEGGSVVAEVADRGHWKGVVRDGDRGRGLAILAALLSELEIRPGPGGTTVRMVRPLGPGRRRAGRRTAELLVMPTASPERVESELRRTV